MNILIAGAQLQGIEAIYLSKKAGYRVTAADRKWDAPGADLADTFVCCDLTDREKMIPLFQMQDVVLPAIEDEQVLMELYRMGKETNTPVLFDPDAYHISQSKNTSNHLFRKIGLPLPEVFPSPDTYRYPVIIKPDNRSGSDGVSKVSTEKEFMNLLKKIGDSPFIAQKFVDGPSFSLEVIGDGEHAVFLQITQVITDDRYDCKRIEAPAVITPDEEKQMLEIGKALFHALRIRGIFDIEVISDNGSLTLLEIDARLPSQTPVSVWNSTGINMVEILTQIFLSRDTGWMDLVRSKRNRTCLYQQIQIKDHIVTVAGEHIMKNTKHLQLISGFFGSDEAITDYRKGCDECSAIVILTRDTREEVYLAWKYFLQEIGKVFRIEKIIDTQTNV